MLTMTLLLTFVLPTLNNELSTLSTTSPVLSVTPSSVNKITWSNTTMETFTVDWSSTESTTKKKKRKKKKISIAGKSMTEICAMFGKFGKDCTCENLPRGLCKFIKTNKSARNKTDVTFTCNTKINRLEAGLALFTSIVGIIGNGIVTIVTVKFWKTSTRHQRLIGALAFADFTFAFPQIMLRVPKINSCVWIYREGWCKFIQGFNNWCGHIALGFIMIIAFERYLGVVRPFSRGLTNVNLGMLIFLNAVMATASVAPMVAVLGLDEFKLCIEKWPKSYSSLVYSWYLTIFYFIIPMVIIGFFYYYIMKTLRSAAYKNKNSSPMDETWRINRRKENERIMVILAAIFIAFFVLVLPNRLVWLLIDHIGVDNMSDGFYNALKLVGLIPYFCHVAINPIIYSVVDRKFREKVSKLFSCFRRDISISHRMKNFQPTKKTNSTSSLKEGSITTREGVFL